MTTYIDANTNKLDVPITFTVADFGLAANLDTDATTLYNGAPRPPDQIASIQTVWAARNTVSPTQMIQTMNDVGASVGDIANATGDSPSSIRAWLLTNAYWSPAPSGVSSSEINWAITLGSPVGPLESFISSAHYFKDVNSGYIKFPTTFATSQVSYTASYIFKTFDNNSWTTRKTFTIDFRKTYNPPVTGGTPTDNSGFVIGGTTPPSSGTTSTGTTSTGTTTGGTTSTGVTTTTTGTIIVPTTSTLGKFTVTDNGAGSVAVSGSATATFAYPAARQDLQQVALSAAYDYCNAWEIQNAMQSVAANIKTIATLASDTTLGIAMQTVQAPLDRAVLVNALKNSGSLDDIKAEIQNPTTI